jgi:hypothetical protein
MAARFAGAQLHGIVKVELCSVLKPLCGARPGLVFAQLGVI